MITGILLAAGEGRRFGGGKLRAEISPGTAMCVAALRNLKQAVDTVVAVVRPGDAEVMRLLEASGARVIVCENAREGMGASLACGVRASADAHGWIIALADMPFIEPDTIRAIASAIRHGALIAAPTYHGQRGHPVGFAAALGAELAALGGDTGAREVIKRHAESVLEIAIKDAGVIHDIDTPAQLPTAPTS